MRELVAVCGGCLVWMLLEVYQTGLQDRRRRLFVQGLPPNYHPSLRKKALVSLTALGRVYRSVVRWSRLEQMEEKIERAGLVGKVTADAVLGGKITCASVGIVVGFVVQGIFLGVIVAAVLSFVPDLYLIFKADKRKAEIQKTLPHIIDLLVIATEAGMSFEGALEVVTRSSRKGILYQELAQVLDEIRLGSSREDALRNLEQRLDHPDVRSFVLTLVQGQKLGTPISRILSVVAHQIRVKQAAAFETRANQAPIKILFPLLLFIFPSLLLVLLGPIMLRGFF